MSKKKSYENNKKNKEILCVVQENAFGKCIGYTIGMHEFYELPEFLVVGQSVDYCSNILMVISFLVKQKKIKISNGIIISDFLPKNFILGLISVKDSHKVRIMREAYEKYKHWDFKVFQIVIPDNLGYFPWDQKYKEQTNKVNLMIDNIKKKKKISLKKMQVKL